MDRERGLVDGPVALDDFTLVVHQEHVGLPDLPEAHAERVDPEVIESFGIARGDVTRNALVESEATEQSERRRKSLLAVQALGGVIADLVHRELGRSVHEVPLRCVLT